MPKTSMYTLTWLPEQGRYELYERGEALPVRIEGELWFAWLAAHSSFAFQGRQGRLTLLKESRPRSEEGYWYAYRSLSGRTGKKYLGRSRDMTPAHLEEVARALTAEKGSKQDEQVEAREAASGQEILQAPLLAPKLRVPQSHSSLVARERLLRLLDASQERRLTLICAPAGFGKTTLVSQWIAESSARANSPQVAWVSLDAGDNDPVRFWRYVVTACQLLLPDRGTSALARLQAATQRPFEPSFLEVALTIFLNELSRSERQGILVLEDYHVIVATRIHETLSFLLDHLPPTLHLVLISRSDPALPLARLRAQGELAELRAADLRFSQEEMEEFLQQTLVLSFSTQALARLEKRLEGWVAGLRLVALALQRHTTEHEVEHFLTSLAGSHRPILEYFVTEVLDAQSEPIQSFLLQTSTQPRLTASLCDAIASRDDSEQLLETLERANLFLEPLDDMGQWYRYHALFADSMQYEARRRLGEDGLRELAGRASRWYEQQGQLMEAVENAFQARDLERCADLIERLSETVHLRDVSEFHTLYRWFEQLPEEIFQARPALCLSYSMTLLFVSTLQRLAPGTQAQLERRLHMVEQSSRATGNWSRLGEVFGVLAMVAWLQGEVDRAEDYARQALALLPAENILWRSNTLSVIGRVEIIAGRFDAARQIFLEARELSAATGNQVMTRAVSGMLAGTYLDQGLLQQAAAHFRRLLSDAREKADLDDVGHAQLGLAEIFYEWNELDAAQEAVQEVLEVVVQFIHGAHERHRENTQVLLARIEYAQGQHEAAQQRLTALLANMQSRRPSPVYREVLFWQARFELAAGNIAAVQRWAEAHPTPAGMLPFALAEREELLLARLLIAQGETGRAMQRLNRLLDEAQTAQRLRSTLEIQVLMALAYNSRTQVQEARQMLQTALELARPEGYLRIFLDEGAAMAGLLRAVLAETREKAMSSYVQRLLHAFARESGAQNNMIHFDAALLTEPLSQQERRVLRLLAAGLSNPQIARELVVSVNTVRTQVQSIYRKLNVSNRVAASELARDLRLL